MQENNEISELQQSRETIETMKSRMKRLEEMNLDLEYRLQDQGRQCMAAERECFEIRKEWSQKCQLLELEIKKWKDECHAQQLKTEKMKDHLSRTERELYGILQKKYDFMRNQGPTGSNMVGTVPGISHPSSASKLLDKGGISNSITHPDDLDALDGEVQYSTVLTTQYLQHIHIDDCSFNVSSLVFNVFFLNLS